MRHNKKFVFKPKDQNDLHREVLKGLDLDKILCIKTGRALRNDCTIAHNGKLYQIQETVKSKKVLVEERVNGRMMITHNGAILKFKEITTRPEKQKEPLKPRKKTSYKPSADQPWRNSDNKRQVRNKWIWAA